MGWLSISFYDYKLLTGFEGSKYVGLKHFINFFTGMDSFRVISNTLLINIYSLIFVFPIPILFALLLNELQFPKFKRVVQTISYMPYFISTAVLVSMIITILSPSFGTVNAIIKAFGREPIYFLGDPKYFRSIYIISGIWQGTGWSSIVYLSALTTIDEALYEAAIIDGANRFQRIRHITIPGIQSTIIIMLILNIGNLMNIGFDKAFLLQNPLNISASEVITTYVYKQGIKNANVSYATAVGVFNSVINFMLVYASNRLSRKVSETSLW